MASVEDLAILDLNNPDFQETFFALEKAQRVAALDTLRKIRQMTWSQIYQDKGLHWEKIASVKPPKGIDAIYSLGSVRIFVFEARGVGLIHAVVRLWLTCWPFKAKGTLST